MSIFEIKMPKLGESITEGTIMRWAVKVGDTIQEDDVIFEVNTQKVSAEIPSPVAGTVTELLFKEGDVVAIGTVVAKVNMGGSDAVVENVKTEQPKEKTNTVLSIPREEQKPAAPSKNKDKNSRWYSPLVLSIAQDAKIPQAELDAIAGTGYLGRVSKKDIENYIAQKSTGAAPAQKSENKSANAPEHKAPAVAFNAEDEVKEMDYVRRIIADHMVMSKKVSPHVTSVVEVDVTNLVRWRERNKDEFYHREGVKLTYMPAIVEATAKALAEFPRVNASVDGYNMILKKHINIGVAVSLNDGNLIVPVVHNADTLNMNGLGKAIDSLAVKARANKLSSDDIQGGTFTITNFGTFKNIFGTPIINQPQVAILGVGYIEKKPAVIETPDGDMIAIRHKMYLSLSYDHRIVDGAMGGAFLRRIADHLEEDYK